MSKSTESPYLPRAPFIDHSTTAPGSKGIGRALIKNAIQKSRSWGDEGKCLLVPLGVGDPGDAQKAYEALGFIELNGGYSLLTQKK